MIVVCNLHSEVSSACVHGIHWMRVALASNIVFHQIPIHIIYKSLLGIVIDDYHDSDCLSISDLALQYILSRCPR
jgi:hypothetical protein